MEIHNVAPGAMSPSVEWEARRVATAFGVSEWEESKYSSGSYVSSSGPILCWSFNSLGTLDQIRASGDGSARVAVTDRENDWNYTEANDCVALKEFMARGLYKLGFGDEAVLSQLPPLSAHEKLELKLSMPREFWPEKWEEKEETT